MNLGLGKDGEVGEGAQGFLPTHKTVFKRRCGQELEWTYILTLTFFLKIFPFLLA